MLWEFFAFGLAVLCTFTLPMSCWAEESRSRPAAVPNQYRLARDVRPTQYDLCFAPDLVRFTFDGEEIVHVKVLKPTQEFVLNAAELTVSDALICRTEQAAVKDQKPNLNARTLKAKIVLNAPLERLSIVSPVTLSPGVYTLKLKFYGKINDQNRGFYRSKYKDSKGQMHPVALTIMEPTDARRMFPCFDEPEFKATFKIKAIIDAKFRAISNGEISKEYVDRKLGKKVVVFGSTPEMSSYLVALFVGNFVPGAKTVLNGVPITVWAPPEREQLESFALDKTRQLMEYFNKYFGIAYPFKKLDLVVVPESEDDGMENVAAIAYQESAILIDSQTASITKKKDVTRLLAHELAHMWFGDLVTMRWWHELWLKESFADWTSYKAVDAVMPSVKAWDIFAFDRASTIFTDCLQSTRAIRYDVTNPGQIFGMYDEITYMKGASVLRMLESYLGEKNFQKGIHLYLSRHKFSNASADDLWGALAEATGKPIPKIMAGWINQAGLPLVSVGLDASKGQATLTQTRCFIEPDAKGEESLWSVPLKLRETDKTTAHLLDNKTLQLPLKKVDLRSANADGSGYYRVLYDPAFLSPLPDLKAKMNGAERFSLLNDQWYLFLANKISKDQYIQLLRAYEQDSDPLVVLEVIRQLWYWRTFNNEGATNCCGVNIESDKQLASPLEVYGWQGKPDESGTVTLARSAIIETLGTIGHDADMVSKARSLYRDMSARKIQPDLQKSIINIVAFNGDKNEWEQLSTAWRKAQNPDDQQKYLFALAWFQKPELLQKTLELSLTNDVPIEQAADFIALVLRNAPDRHFVWQFVKEHWEELCGRCTRRLIVPTVAALGLLTMSNELEDLKQLFHEHSVALVEADMARAVERVAARNAFVKRRRAD